MKKSLLTLVALSFALTACATDPYTGEKRASRTAIGTGAGAAIGAGAGALIGGQRGALIGAGVGAAGGAAVGARMDLQARELREQLVGTGVQVQEIDGQIRLIMPGNITFDTNQTEIKHSFRPVLDSISKVLARYNRTTVQVIGHTDSTGSRDHNLRLSVARAESVGKYLSLRGVANNRIATFGAGPDQPIASNDTEAGRAQNRRVEIYLANQ
jgi:outer membrane protein OmpA-like peptidoglycan-associated protein